jgi:hypothetical protein
MAHDVRILHMWRMFVREVMASAVSVTAAQAVEQMTENGPSAVQPVQREASRCLTRFTQGEPLSSQSWESCDLGFFERIFCRKTGKNDMNWEEMRMC